MAKDDLANLRLDLAPKLNCPLSLWNPLDYLRLLFWVFYFPQALRWYMDRFGGGFIDCNEITLQQSFQGIRQYPTQQKLIIQGILLILGINLFAFSFFSYVGIDIHEIGVSLGISSGILVCLAGSLISGVSYGVSSGVSGGISSGILLGITFHTNIYSFAGGIASGIAGGIAIGVAGGISLGLPAGISLSLRSGIILTVVLSLMHTIVHTDIPEFSTYLAIGIFASIGACLGLLRPDSWILGLIGARLNCRHLNKAFSITPIPINSHFSKKLLTSDWEKIRDSAYELLAFSNQFILVLATINNAIASTNKDQVIFNLSQLASSPNDWKLILYTSSSLRNALTRKFIEYLIIFPFNKQFSSSFNVQPRTNTIARATAAGFWYLHEEQPIQAAQAFAVVRDIRHGDEMHGLASLLALFDAAETAEQIAAIELPDLPRDRTLRPHTWEAIRRFCHVISDTKTVQASASRSARAFATNRALGELQHIIEYEADLPEAERSLVVEIAKTWRNALLDITAEVGDLAITQPVQNPYVIGDPVEGELFVGRDDIMRQLQELWLMGNHLQSVVIYGHRRMGKTSILKNIESRLGSAVQVAYVNLLKSAGAETLSDVLLAISDQVAATLAIAPPRDADMETHPARSFERFMQRATDSLTDGKGLIIALDEFEKIEELIDAGKLEASFLAYLRGLVQDSPRVGFAFAGLHTLEEMSADYFQPFFASVIPIKVDFFQPATVQTLLPNPGNDFPLDYDYDALDAIWELTAGQPYLTQLIGFQLVRRYNDQVFERQQSRDPKFTVADVQAVIDQPDFFAQGKPYFQGVWAQAGQDPAGQQALLAALAPHPDGLPTEDLWEAVDLDDAACAAAVQTLENHDVVRQDQGQVAIIVEVFRRWVLRDDANRTGRQER